MIDNTKLHLPEIILAGIGLGHFQLEGVERVAQLLRTALQKGLQVIRRIFIILARPPDKTKKPARTGSSIALIHQTNSFEKSRVMCFPGIRVAKIMGSQTRGFPYMVRPS